MYLKASTEADWTATSGRAFHSAMVRGKKDSGSACIVFCRQGAVRPLGELRVLVLWEGLGHSVTVTPYKVIVVVSAD